MKNYYIYVLICLNFLLVFFLNSCEKETTKYEPEDVIVVDEGNILGAVRLTTDNIQILKEYVLTDCMNKPSIWYEKKGDTVSYAVTFSYIWNLSDTGSVEVSLMVTNSNELAYGYYIGNRNSMNISWKIPDDDPVIAGDHSYNKGGNFVRNNMYVKIVASGELYDKTDILAKQIDDLIIKETNFLSLSEVQPVIKVFNLEDNPVYENTKTLINLEVEDPNNAKIYYHWKKNIINGNSGSVNKEFQAFSFEASLIPDYLLTNKLELTVLAINEYGHIADSTILVTTYKD